MSFDAWPSALSHGLVAFDLVGGERSGGAAPGLAPATGASRAGCHWQASLTSLAILTRAQLLAARALQLRLEGGAAAVLVEACDGGLTPQIPGGTAMEAVLGADAVAGDTEIAIITAGDHYPLRGGEHFSIDYEDADVGRRMHRIAEVVADSPFTVRIQPPIRADVTADAVLDFATPSCPMALAGGFSLPTDMGRSSATDALFVEWFDRSPVNVPAGLRPLTLVPSTIAEGSAEDTLVGRLFGMTSGSTVTLTDDAGGRFKLVDDAGVLKIYAAGVATDYDVATSHDITVTETLAGKSNSPLDTVLTIEVTEVVIAGEVPHRWWAIPITINGGHGSQLGMSAIELAETAGGADASAGFVSVTVIGAGTQIAGSEIGKAFDGNPATNFLYNGATTATILVDYGATEANWRSFADLRVTCHTDDVTLGARAFGLSWSDDSVAFTSIATRDIGYSQVKGDARSVLEEDPTDGSYRCHRLLCIDNNGGITIALGEISMAGLLLPTGSADDTLGRDIASSTNSGSYPASNAHDGNPSTSWQTSSSLVSDQWIGRISPGPVTVSQITATCSTGVADPTGRAPRNVKRQGSHKNNNDWVDLATATWTGWTAGGSKTV